MGMGEGPFGAARAARGATAALALSALAGCAQVTGLVSDAEPPPCPEAAIVAGLDRAYLADPAAPGRVGIEASMEGLATRCRFFDDRVELDIEVDLLARPARGYVGGEATLAYFVALMAPDGSIVSKDEFRADVVTSIDDPGSGSRERLTQTAPIVAAFAPSDWRVFLGFDLDPAAALQQLRALEGR